MAKAAGKKLREEIDNYFAGISRIDVCIPDLFRFVPYQKENLQ